MNAEIDKLIRKLWSECRAIGVFDEAGREDLADNTRSIAAQSRYALRTAIEAIEVERDVAQARLMEYQQAAKMDEAPLYHAALLEIARRSDVALMPGLQYILDAVLGEAA